MATDWRNLSYLERGTSRQLAALRSIRSLGIVEKLAEFDPVHVSTLCLDIDIPSSDLDFVCCASDLAAFESAVRGAFENLPRFTCAVKEREGKHRVIATFSFDEFDYEIFGSAAPISENSAYRHLVQTERLIEIGGAGMREAIRSLKLGGLKTEPAIAQILNLPGNPYQAVLKLERLTESELRAVVPQNL